MANSVLLLLAISSNVAYALQDNTTNLDVITPSSADSAQGNSSSDQTTPVNTKQMDADIIAQYAAIANMSEPEIAYLLEILHANNNTKLGTTAAAPIGREFNNCTFVAMLHASFCHNYANKVEHLHDPFCQVKYERSLCIIEGFCRCSYKAGHFAEKLEKAVFFGYCAKVYKKSKKDYPYIEKDYCRELQEQKTSSSSKSSTDQASSSIAAISKSTTKKVNGMSTRISTSSTSTTTKWSVNCQKVADEADLKCAQSNGSSEGRKNLKGPEAECRGKYDSILCTIDAVCSKCNYAEAHWYETLAKSVATNTQTECATYFKGYKYMSENRCTSSTVSPRISSTTKGSTVWIIVGSSIGGVLVLCCLCICVCICFCRKDDKASNGNGAGKVLSKANSATPMSAIPASNIGSVAKASGIPYSKMDSAAKMSSMLSSKAPAKRKFGAKAAAKSRV